MGIAIIHILIAIAICFFAITGYRRGFVGQLSGLLGMGFGIVAAALMPEEFAQALADILPTTKDEIVNGFAQAFLPKALVFLTVYLVFLSLSKIIRSVFSVINNGLANSLAGGLFGVFQTVMIVSVALNMLLCTGTQRELVRTGEADDANLAEITMLLAPTLLSTPDVKDLALQLQLRDAKSIS